MPDDHRCATCRWWDWGDDDPEAWGGCGLGTTDAQGEAVESVSLAVAMATRGAGAELVTAPTFGCVQWAARDP